MALWKDIARQCQSLPRFSFCVLSPSRIPTEQLTTRQFRYCSTKNESELSGLKKSFKDMMDTDLWKMTEKVIQAEVTTRSYDLLKTTGVLIIGVLLSIAGMLVTIIFFIDRSGRKLEQKMETNLGKHEQKMEASMGKHEQKMEKLAAAIDLILVHLKIKQG